MPPEPDRVIVAAVEREPGEPALCDGAGTPRGDEGGLAEARGSVNEDELGGGRIGQRPHELPPLHPLPTRPGSVELRLDRRIKQRPGRSRVGERPRTMPRPSSLLRT